MTTASTTVAPFTAATASPATRANSGSSGSITHASSSEAIRAERRSTSPGFDDDGSRDRALVPKLLGKLDMVSVRRFCPSKPMRAPLSRVTPAILLGSEDAGAAGVIIAAHRQIRNPIAVEITHDDRLSVDTTHI